MGAASVNPGVQRFDGQHDLSVAQDSEFQPGGMAGGMAGGGIRACGSAAPRAATPRYDAVPSDSMEAVRFRPAPASAPPRAGGAAFTPVNRPNTLRETLGLIVELLRNVFSASPYRNCQMSWHGPRDTRTFEQFFNFVEQERAPSRADVDRLMDNLTGLGARLGDAYFERICEKTLQQAQDVPALRQLKEILDAARWAPDSAEAPVDDDAVRLRALLSRCVGQRLAGREHEQCEQLAEICRERDAPHLGRVVARLMEIEGSHDDADGSPAHGRAPLPARVATAVGVLAVEEQREAIAELDRIHAGQPAAPDLDGQIGAALTASLNRFARLSDQERTVMQKLLDVRSGGVKEATSALRKALEDYHARPLDARDIRPCQAALSRLDAVAAEFDFLVSTVAEVRLAMGRQSQIPALEIDAALVDRAILTLFEDIGATEEPPDAGMDDLGSLKIGAVWQSQPYLLEQLGDLQSYSGVLGDALKMLAGERLARHEELGARHIAHILQHRLAPRLDEAWARPALCASVLRDVLDEVMYVDQARGILSGSHDMSFRVATPESLGKLRSAFLDAGRRADGEASDASVFGPLWEAWSHVAKTLHEDMLKAFPEGALDTGRTLGTALRTLGDLGGLLGFPAADAVCPLTDAQQRAWRAALAAKVGVALDDDGRIQPDAMRRIHPPVQELLRKTDTLKWETWSVADAMPEGGEWEVVGDAAGVAVEGADALENRQFAQHRVTKQFIADFLTRGVNNTLSIDGNALEPLSAYAEDASPEPDLMKRALRIDEFLTELEKARPGSSERVMLFLHQGLAAFYSIGMMGVERALPLANPTQYAFHLTSMANQDIKLKVAVRFDEIAKLQKLADGACYLADCDGGTAEYSNVIVIPHDPDQPVRQLGLMAFEMKAKAAGAFMAA
ncbi:hypothetical protein [Achromobacter aloeverae]